jgi:hypothetical protein
MKGSTMSSTVIGLSPIVWLPTRVSKKQCKKQAELEFVGCAQLLKHSGRTFLTAAMTLPSTQVWFTVRSSCFTFHRHAGSLSRPGLHSPSDLVENHVPFK